MLAMLQSAWTAAGRMAQLLRDEYQALSQADSAALTGIARDKQVQMQALEQAQIGWDQLLVASGLPTGNTGMQQWLSAWRAYHAAGRVSSNIDAAALWRGLADGLRTIRKLNGINGAVIAESDRHVRDLLGTLRGNRETRVYGFDGRNRGYASGQDLATF